MTPWQNQNTAIIRRMTDDMKLRNLAPSTIDAYTFHVGKFAEAVGRSVEQATPEDVRSFQLHLVNVRKIGWSSFNQAVCGLRFLYRVTFPRPWVVTMIPFSKKPKKLPTVLAATEVSRLLSCVRSMKHRTFLLTLYAAGLRVSEAASLRIPDIDSERMLLRIASGKGQKERLVPFSPRLLQILRDYWKQIRSPEYLFPGKTFEAPISPATIQMTCKQAATKAEISKNVTPHTFRHSYATGLLEAGVDLLTISRLLGHKSCMTTMIYLHVSRLHLDSTPSPIDWLPVQQLLDWAQTDGNSHDSSNPG